MGSCAAPSAKGDDKFITTDYLQQCRRKNNDGFLYMIGFAGHCHFQKTTAPDNAV
uniref:hypothetical protein n=1 Tax=Enterobacter kobei TaxID=208224 RepID=UPI0024B5F9C2|nr:hypothetical protein [Enterobacter kobei]